MDKTYEQDGKGEESIAYLHYFRGSADWYILEKDSEPEQFQAFGWADLGGGGELGYISIIDLVQKARPFCRRRIAFLRCGNLAARWRVGSGP